jgi:excisionase family DNA binding protein
MAVSEVSATEWHATARLLTAEEVAGRLGVLPSWVNKAARANRIPHVRVGRYRRFRWPDIEMWLEDQRAGM